MVNIEQLVFDILN